ncbi:putative gustatory receptor 59c [Drosophila kikkawai]|uniref:Gustatory receptor n=1 Tax=Drosophila kikkawai TaxID=30033 RepID=A0A6P4HS07_DROKI|nr:putative gustatory receptor 59c [Drosophila kikkawai]
MADPVELILRFVYWYGRLVGVINFEVDLRTKKARITRRATICAAIHNGILISLLYVQKFNDGSIRLAWNNAKFLHEYFFLLITLVRHWAVLFILCSRWLRRCRILKLWNELARMVRETPEVMRLYRRGIFLKFVISFLSDSMHTILDFSAQRKKLTLSLALNLFVWYTFATILNVTVGLYYLSILQVHGHYVLLHEDIKKLIGEAQRVSCIRNRRGGVFATKCCSLADELELLAQRQAKLQGLLFEMWTLFQVQTLGMSLVYYLSTMGTIYYAFCSVLYNTTGLGSTYLGLLLIALSTVFFYADNFITLNIGFLIRDEVDKIHRVLAERTLFCQELDERLEAAFDSFELQLARAPCEFYIFGLYKVERGTFMAMINSVITHSIVLVQWELQQ